MMLPTILLVVMTALLGAAVWLTVHVVVFGGAVILMLWRVLVWWPVRWAWGRRRR